MNIKYHQKTGLIFLLFVALGLTTSSAVFSKDAQSERTQLVDKELSCISKVKNRQGAFNWDDVCYLQEDSASASTSKKSMDVVIDANGGVTVGKKAVKKPAPPKKVPAAQADKDVKETDDLMTEDLDLEQDWTPAATSLVLDEDDEYDRMTVAERDRKKINFEFGSENLYYDFDSDAGNSRHGNLFGVFGALTYRFGPSEDLAKDNNITMLKLDTHLAQDIDAFVFDGRGLAGFDLIYANNTRLTPFLGLGYRYSRDKDAGSTQVLDDIYGSSWFYSNGARSVKEEFKYVYIPLGFELHRPIRDLWAIQLTCEFDVILQGSSTRHYEELGPLIISADDGSGHVPNAMEFDHDKGYGWRVAVRLLRSAEEVDLFIEPFVRFWKLEDSDIEQFRTDGTGTIWQYLETGEPVIDQVRGHEVTEYGFKAGVLF